MTICIAIYLNRENETSYIANALSHTNKSKIKQKKTKEHKMPKTRNN